MRAFLVLLMLIMFGAPDVRAQSVDAGHAVASFVSEREAIASGDSFWGALTLDLDKDWHVYWRNAGDAGVAPAIRWTTVNGASAGEFVWPAPHTIPVETLMNYGYSDAVTLPFRIQAPDGLTPGDTLVLEGEAEWQICLDICIWEAADLRLEVLVASAPELAKKSAARIAGALEDAPQPLMGQARFVRQEDMFRLSVVDTMFAEALDDAARVRFFPYGHEIEHFPEQALRTGPEGGVLDLKVARFAEEDLKTLDGVVVVEQAKGRRASFQVKALEGDVPAGVDAQAFAPAAHGGSAPTRVLAGPAQLLTWLGLAFLGGLVLNLMPCVLPVLSIKANGLVHAAGKGDASVKTHGAAYVAGVTLCFALIGAVLLALRAAGEQAGLGFQLQYPPMVLGMAFLMYLISLNLLGMFEIGGGVMGVGGSLADKSGAAGAFFTGLLAAVVGAPCVGPLLAASLGAVVSQPGWMVMAFLIVMGLGMAAPFGMLAIAPGLVRYLPKPGKWMETLRQALAFPLLLTAVWLLWVFAGQRGADAAMLALTGAAIIALGLWVSGRWNEGRTGAIVGGVIVVCGLAAPFALTHASTVAAPSTDYASGPDGGGVEQADWSPQKVAALQAEGRPIFVDFTARWCVTCQVNKRVTLHSDAVQRAFAENGVVFLTADWTNRNQMIADELAAHERAGVPLYLFYPANGADPVILPQILTPGLVIGSIQASAGG